MFNLAVESLHRLGNIDNKCCFGVNKNKGLKFFMKVHLLIAISNTSSFVENMNKNDQESADSSDVEEEMESIDEIIIDWDECL